MCSSNPSQYSKAVKNGFQLAFFFSPADMLKLLEKTLFLNLLVDTSSSRLTSGFIVDRSITVSLLTGCGPARDTVLTNRQTRKLNFDTCYIIIYT